MTDRVVLDTSIVVDGKISEMVKAGKIRCDEIIVPQAVLDELQAQASKSWEPGFLGLSELKRLREACEARGISLRFSGARPTLDDIRLARSGRMDAIIRDVAKAESGVLVTADYVQALVAEAEGVRVQYLRPEVKTTGLAFEAFFTPDTLSVHLKKGVPPMAKRGRPGSFTLVRVQEQPCTEEELNRIIREITEAARISEQGFVEISRSGALVLQLGLYRVAITRPPFSSGLEVTIVRPIVKLTLEDYKLSAKLMARLRDRAEGVLIAGPPGSGKTTLASSLAEFYTGQGKIVKTFESPRDLQVGPEVTQYGPLEGDFERTAEILLLVRPDYTVFDEVRKSKDFQVFADMRLAGVGMVGVVHASDPVNAVQRFMGRVELGMIPHILDTVIFVKAGEIRKVYELDLRVKVPSGMTEADLARPVVDVRDFETGELEYEIYTFGEENVIVPVSKTGPAPDVVRRLAEERILQVVRKFDPKAEVEIVSSSKAVVRVDRQVIPRLIGRGGIMITEIEEGLGIRIDVEPKIPSLGEELPFKIGESGNVVELRFDPKDVGRAFSLYVNDEYVFATTVGHKAKVRISKSSDAGKKLASAVVAGREIKAFTQA